MTGSTVSAYLDPKCIAWLENQKNRSMVINNLIKRAMVDDSDASSLRKNIVLLESNRKEIDNNLNIMYGKLNFCLEKEEEIQNAEKERITNMLADKDKQVKEKHRKIEASPYFKDIQKLTEYDDKKALAIIEKCRRAGNRDFGTYDIKEYLEAKHGTDKP